MMPPIVQLWRQVFGCERTVDALVEVTISCDDTDGTVKTRNSSSGDSDTVAASGTLVADVRRKCSAREGDRVQATALSVGFLLEL